MLSIDLAGAVPPELGDIEDLELLWVYGNRRLMGPLPAEITQLTALTHLRIAATGLCVPADSAFDALLARLETFDGSRCG